MFASHPRIELVGLADVDPARTARAHERWSVTTDRDAVALVHRTRPHILSICTPDETHADVIERVLRECEVRLVFAEKPLATSTKAAQSILDQATRVGTTLAMNHTRRYVRAFREVGEDLKAGRYGRPLVARMTYTKGLFHNGVHGIDLLRFWFGEPARCAGRRTAWGPESDPTYDAEFWFPGGLHARLDGFDERVATVFEMEVLTNRSRIRFWRGGNEWSFEQAQESAEHPGHRFYVPLEESPSRPRFVNALDGALRAAADDLVSFLDGRGDLACSGADGLAAVAWAERVADAA